MPTTPLRGYAGGRPGCGGRGGAAGCWQSLGADRFDQAYWGAPAHRRRGRVPFIPIEGITIEDCVALARRIGEEIWNRYRIPVFFYEAAACRPDRTNLENIRRGQFEGLRDEMKRNHNRLPDIGEPKLHPTAGVTVVGARKFLIAYNVNLNTSDVGIANKIAKAIRFSSGGIRYVKSMGVELKARNLAQVSINLTDFEQTPMHRVYEMVKREAARYGVIPVGSEIVGLIPKKAIEMAADYLLAGGEFFAGADFRKQIGVGADRQVRGSWRAKRASWRDWPAVFWKRLRRLPQRRAAAAWRHLLRRWRPRWGKWSRDFLARRNRNPRLPTAVRPRWTTVAARAAEELTASHRSRRELVR